MDQEFEDSREEKLHNEDEHHQHQQQQQQHEEQGNQHQEQGHEHLFGRQKPVHSALGGGKRTFSVSNLYVEFYAHEKSILINRELDNSRLFMHVHTNARIHT